MLKRTATPNTGADPANASEAARLAADLRSGFASLQERINAREQDGQAIESLRGELRAHAQSIADMQEALTRSTRPSGIEVARAMAPEARLAAFGHWLRTGDAAQLQELGAWRPDLAIRATVGLTNIGPQGGYVVLDNFDQAVERVSRIYSQVRAFANVVTISQGSTYSKATNKSGAAAVWTEEAGAEPESDAIEWAINQITAHEARATSKYSRQALADPIVDLVAAIAADYGDAYGKLEGAAFVSGSGVGQPEGFMAPAAGSALQSGVTEVAYGKLGFVKTGHATLWTADTANTGGEAKVFQNVMTALKSEYLASAAFYMNRVTLGEVMLFRDSQGHPLWQPSLQAGVPSQLRGYAVRTIEEMADRGANTFPVAFGDMRAYYTVVDRAGLEILPNPYKEPGFTLFHSWKRVGGKVMKSEALKAIKVAA